MTLDTKIKGINKGLFITVIVESVLLALGLLGVMLLNDYRTGALVISPPLKAIANIVFCFGTLLFFIGGSTGWMLIVAILMEDKKDADI